MLSTAASVRTIKFKVTVGTAPSFRSSERAEKRREVYSHWTSNGDAPLICFVINNRSHTICRLCWLSTHLYSFTRSWRRNTKLWRQRKVHVRQGPGYVSFFSIFYIPFCMCARICMVLFFPLCSCRAHELFSLKY